MSDAAWAPPVPCGPAERAALLWERVVAVAESDGEHGAERIIALLPKSDLRLLVASRAVVEARSRVA